MFYVSCTLVSSPICLPITPFNAVSAPPKKPMTLWLHDVKLCNFAICPKRRQCIENYVEWKMTCLLG